MMTVTKTIHGKYQCDYKLSGGYTVCRKTFLNTFCLDANFIRSLYPKLYTSKERSLEGIKPNRIRRLKVNHNFTEEEQRWSADYLLKNRRVHKNSADFEKAFSEYFPNTKQVPSRRTRYRFLERFSNRISEETGASEEQKETEKMIEMLLERLTILAQSNETIGDMIIDLQERNKKFQIIRAEKYLEESIDDESFLLVDEHFADHQSGFDLKHKSKFFGLRSNPFHDDHQAWNMQIRNLNTWKFS